MMLYAPHDSSAAGLEPNSAPKKSTLKQLLLELIDKLFTSLSLILFGVSPDFLHRILVTFLSSKGLRRLLVHP